MALRFPGCRAGSLSIRTLIIGGRVSDDELARLYANAKFTVFPFIHEPFGYVPVESMACGTPPVLTYDKQGAW